MCDLVGSRLEICGVCIGSEDALSEDTADESILNAKLQQSQVSFMEAGEWTPFIIAPSLSI